MLFPALLFGCAHHTEVATSGPRAVLAECGQAVAKACWVDPQHPSVLFCRWKQDQPDAVLACPSWSAAPHAGSAAVGEVSCSPGPDAAASDCTLVDLHGYFFVGPVDPAALQDVFHRGGR